EDLEGCLSHEVGRVFDLSKEVPLSLCIFKLDSVYYLSIVIHHIAFDGWSRDVFLGELSTIYKSLLVGESPVLPSMALQYRDFALWQRDYLSGDVLNTQLDYWKRELSGFESLNLPLDFKRPSVISYDGGNVSFIVPSSTSIGLRSLSKDLGVSLYSVMLSGYYVMLSAYSGQDDIVLGTSVANRHHVGLE
ncbi:condensation domain-containing protein, partial [Chryseobacterium potabilaquae]|uniref:condensation domain-containing protein n=1 Tax=Chryseobacterium potabilaquae TaxID=2675057 RepID=UPI001E377C95